MYTESGGEKVRQWVGGRRAGGLNTEWVTTGALDGQGHVLKLGLFGLQGGGLFGLQGGAERCRQTEVFHSARPSALSQGKGLAAAWNPHEGKGIRVAQTSGSGLAGGRGVEEGKGRRAT